MAEIEGAADADAQHNEVGDLLFAVVNYARHLGIDAEEALRHANSKFERRFRDVEASADSPLQDMSLDDLEVLWQRAKAREKTERRS